MDTATDFHPSTLLVPILALPGLLVCLPPLVLHCRARNLPASVLTGSLMLANLFNFVNAIIWSEDDFKGYDGVGLCDLEVKVFIGVAASEAGSTLCIFRQLSKAIDTSRLLGRETNSQRKLTRAVEAVFCIGIALHSVATHYIVQPNRYLLMPVLGCGISLDPSWVGLVLIAVWPLLLYLLAAAYAGQATVRLLRHRREVSAVLEASSSSKSYYFRLFAFASIFLLINLPIGVFAFVRNGLYHLRPYSWFTVHPKEWSQIIHAVTWEQSNPWDGADRYVQIAAGYIIFAFWGLSREARIGYRSIWRQFSDPIARSPMTAQSETPVTILLSKIGFGGRVSPVSARN